MVVIVLVRLLVLELIPNSDDEDEDEEEDENEALRAALNPGLANQPGFDRLRQTDIAQQRNP
jgi:hypothetical protein